METRRLLAGIEHSLTLTNEFAPFNVICVLKIEGRLGPESLSRALAALQRKHPLLRARIVCEKGAYYFHFDNPQPVQLDLAERNSPEDWIAVAEDALNRRMDIASGPLMRCIYLHSSREPAAAAEIVLTFNHTILDAGCALPLLREFLSALADEKVDLGSEKTSEGAAAATSLFPRKLAGAGFVRAVISYLMRQMADEAAYRWRARGCRKPPIHATGRNRILPIRFPKSLTDALIRVTRRERITLNAILSAGLMLAVKRHLYPSRDTPFRHITFADLRPYLGTPVPESVLGCCLGMCRFTVQMQDRPDFRKLAREVHDDVYRSNRRGERFLANALSPGMMRMIIRMKAMRMGTTALSYAGPISLGEDWGPVRVLGLHAFTSNITLGTEYSALARLFRGELWCDLFYLDSDLGPEKAQQIADEIRSILDEAASILD